MLGQRYSGSLHTESVCSTAGVGGSVGGCCLLAFCEDSQESRQVDSKRNGKPGDTRAALKVMPRAVDCNDGVGVVLLLENVLANLESFILSRYSTMVREPIHAYIYTYI